MKRKEKIRLVAMKLMGNAGFVPIDVASFDIFENAAKNPRTAKFVNDAKDIISALDRADREESRRKK